MSLGKRGLESYSAEDAAQILSGTRNLELAWALLDLFSIYDENNRSVPAENSLQSLRSGTTHNLESDACTVRTWFVCSTTYGTSTAH